MAVNVQTLIAEGGQEVFLAGCHARSLQLAELVVVAEEVEEAVDEEMGYLGAGRDLLATNFGGLYLGIDVGDADDDFAKRRGGVGCIEEGFTLRCGEGEDISGLVTATVEAVELLDRRGIDEGKLYRDVARYAFGVEHVQSYAAQLRRANAAAGPRHKSYGYGTGHGADLLGKDCGRVACGV